MSGARPSSLVHFRLVDATLPLFLLTFSAVPAVAVCDLEKARDRLAWADDIKDYVGLWHDRGNFGLALEDLELLHPVLDEVAEALANCPFSLTAAQWRLDVRHFRSWADRARLAMAGGQGGESNGPDRVRE